MPPSTATIAFQAGMELGQKLKSQAEKILVEPHKVNRDGWPPGLWDNEPMDAQLWVHGYTCLTMRATLGSWCGYVGVPEDHPWYDKGYDEIEAYVHGGLTFS